MKWLLVIVLLTADGEEPAMDPIPYSSEAECRAAAARFVAHHSKFELHAPSDGTQVTPPAPRSYVECVPESPEARIMERFTAAY